MATQLRERVQRALQKAKVVVARLSDFDIEEVSLVDRPANKRPFIIRKREDALMARNNSVSILKGLASPLEVLATVVTKLDAGVNAEQLAALQDRARGLASDLRDLVPGATGETPKATVLLTEIATKALEDLTGLAEKLKGGTLPEEELAALEKQIASIAESLSALGEKVAAVQAAGADDGAAAPTGTESTEPPATEPAAEPAADPAPAGEPAADPAPAGEPAVSEPAAEPTASAAPLPPLDVSEVLTVSEELAGMVDAMTGGAMTQEAAVALQKRFDDTFLRGGVTIDTGDMETLEKVVAMLAKIMGTDKSAVEKRAEVVKAALTEIAADLRDIGHSVKGAEKVATAVFKRAAGLQLAVAHLAKNLDPAQPAQPAPAAGVDVAAITAAVTAAVAKDFDEKFVIPLSKRVADLEVKNKNLVDENADLRAKVQKFDNAPAGSRASTPAGNSQIDDAADTSTLFPMNYNAERMS